MPYRILYAPWLAPIMSLFVPGWRAITIGSTIIAAAPLNDATLAHERVHVDQWQQYGIGFLPRYVFASVKAVLGGGHWYRDNEFEVAARN